MRRDSLFYKLFQQYPSLLFELLTYPPINAQAYRFDSVAVKEPTFAIDAINKAVWENISKNEKIYFGFAIICGRRIE